MADPGYNENTYALLERARMSLRSAIEWLDKAQKPLLPNEPKPNGSLERARSNAATALADVNNALGRSESDA
jgi:hypothetical protein